MRSEGFIFIFICFLPVDVKSSILSEWCPGFSIYLFRSYHCQLFIIIIIIILINNFISSSSFSSPSLSASLTAAATTGLLQ
ncbi:unnamed protein product [Brassica rapa subsp. trilocularis]